MRQLAIIFCAFLAWSCRTPGPESDLAGRGDDKESDTQTIPGMRDMDIVREALEAAYQTQSIKLVISAGALTKRSIEFGSAVGKIFAECHEPPVCDFQTHEFKDNPFELFTGGPKPMMEKREKKYCYPNAVMNDGRQDIYGVWMTGQSQFTNEQLLAKHNQGQTVTKDKFAMDSGVTNAVRHAYIYCYVAAINGYEKTKWFADNHETYHPGIGVEDTWADYWNNEIGLRFGARVHRLLFANEGYSAAAWEDYRSTVQGSLQPFHQTTQKSADSGQIDILDTSRFQIGKGPIKNHSAIKYACERYLEGVILDRFSERVQVDGDWRVQKIRLMTHLPSMKSRMHPKTFTPQIGADSKLNYLAPPPKYNLPHARQAGQEWLNTVPLSPNKECIARKISQSHYWQNGNGPATLPWAEGDYDRYLPHYRRELDRFMDWLQRTGKFK